jgi:hypothetical protein
MVNFDVKMLRFSMYSVSTWVQSAARMGHRSSWHLMQLMQVSVRRNQHSSSVSQACPFAINFRAEPQAGKFKVARILLITSRT